MGPTLCLQNPRQMASDDASGLGSRQARVVSEFGRLLADGTGPGVRGAEQGLFALKRLDRLGLRVARSRRLLTKLWEQRSGLGYPLRKVCSRHIEVEKTMSHLGYRLRFPPEIIASILGISFPQQPAGPGRLSKSPSLHALQANGLGWIVVTVVARSVRRGNGQAANAMASRQIEFSSGPQPSLGCVCCAERWGLQFQRDLLPLCFFASLCFCVTVFQYSLCVSHALPAGANIPEPFREPGNKPPGFPWFLAMPGFSAG